MVWKFVNDRPVYLQIMDTIRIAVLSGEFQPGQKFPSVRDLAMDAQVNPNTVQHALQELEASGLLVTEGTAGRHVTNDPSILDAARKAQLEMLAKQCLAQFASYGVSPAQAAQMLLEYQAERKDV